MSFALPKRLFRSTGVRLTLLFSVVFVACLLIVLATSYSLLYRTLEAKDQDFTTSKWKEYADVFDGHGPRGLEALLADEAHDPSNPPLIVCAHDATGFLFAHLPRRLRNTTQKEVQEKCKLDANGVRWDRFTLSNSEQSFEALSAPLHDDVVLTVAKSSQEKEAELARFRATLAWLIGPVLILGLFAGWFLADRALKPIRSLTSAMRAIYAGDLHARVPESGRRDELDELIGLFNAMLERIENLMRSMRDTVDNVAHDLRTPIARLRGMAEISLSADSPDALRESLSECLESSEEILRLLNTLMDLSSAEAGTLSLKRERVNLEDIVEEAADLYRLVAEEKHVLLKATVLNCAYVMGDRTRLTQVVANLLDNAVKYTSPGGQVEVTVSSHDADALVSVTDTGSGICEKDLPRIFERLYRADKSRTQRGMGLGLSIVKAIVDAHLGQVSVRTSEGKGSQFTISLPTHLTA